MFVVAKCVNKYRVGGVELNTVQHAKLANPLTSRVSIVIDIDFINNISSFFLLFLLFFYGALSNGCDTFRVFDTRQSTSNRWLGF